ncbi:transposase [Dysgonomonadaceae bacterium zrk40]|nr:transposase [Dysgonomonadaceae bacterium zrk40]
MIRYKSSRQLSISEFKMPFEAKLDENNRWVVLSKIVPWEEFARLYYKNFKSKRGAPTKDARLVLGVIIIKHIMKTDDRGVIEMIQENPYMQYFLGLETFTYEQVMTPSLLVSIRKRIDLDVFESLTDDLIRKGLKLKYFFVIQHLLEQQESMYKKKSHQVEDRIVSIHQPHVRPIVRGKAKAKTEFGAKINISLLEGIRYTGEPLERKPVKEIKSRCQKRKERREAAERNQVEGKFGQGKRGYGLNDIRARLSSTSNSWIGAIIFVMNLIRHMRDIPLPYFVSLLLKLMKVRNINIYPLGPQMKLCA